MKNILLFCVLIVVFGACKKGDTDIDPAKPATAVAGTYNLTSFLYLSEANKVSLNLPTLPYTQNGVTVSGMVSLTPASADDVVDMKLTLKATGEDDETINLSGITVKANGNAYGLYGGDKQVATIDGSTFRFSYSETSASGDRSELTFSAKK